MDCDRGVRIFVLEKNSHSEVFRGSGPTVDLRYDVLGVTAGRQYCEVKSPIEDEEVSGNIIFGLD
jgi:hypothetical protein